MHRKGIFELSTKHVTVSDHARIQKGGTGGAIKVIKSAFNVGPSSARPRSWQADDDPLTVIFGSFLPHQTKKNIYQNWPSSDKTF